MKETRMTTDVMQAVVWFVLNNSPEVDADILAYREESPDNVETSFPAWFNYKIREKKVTDGCSEELFSLACGPTSACTYPACIVNGVKFVVHERDILHTTQSSGVSTPGLDGEMYYGQLEEILELTYISPRNVVVERVYHRDVVESDQDVIHGRSSSHVTLSVDDVVAHVLDDDDVVVSDDDEVNPSTNVEEMACVAPRSHGGDAGGSPPRRPNRPVPAQCQSKKLCLETGNASLKKAFRENNKQPLQLGFDYLGNFASMLNSLMGKTVRPLPLACEWEEIPEAFKAHIYPTLRYACYV
ncbi:hypothetical protein Tco_0247667 [Tanacetum coccineum]